MPDVTVTLRFFAAARAMTGLDELPCVFDHPPTLDELIDRLAPGPGVDPGDLSAVIGRSSFLIDGLSTRDRSLVVADGATVDVMPPFAGG